MKKLDNKKMWESILNARSFPVFEGETITQWLQGVIRYALKDQGLKYDTKTCEIVEIEPKSGWYRCIDDKANEINAAVIFDVGKIYYYDENQGMKVDSGYLGVSEENLLKYFHPTTYREEEVKEIPRLKLEAGKFYICIHDWSDDGWAKFLRGDIVKCEKEGYVLDPYGVPHYFDEDVAFAYFREVTKEETKKDNQELTEFEKAVQEVIKDAINFEDKFLKKDSAKLLSIARKQIASEINVYRMETDFIENAEERFRFDAYFYKKGIEDTLNKIKGE